MTTTTRPHPATVAPNAVSRWTKCTDTTTPYHRLATRCLTAAAELCADSPDLADALDEIASELRYLSRLWDGVESTRDYLTTNAAEWQQQAEEARDMHAEQLRMAAAQAGNGNARGALTFAADAAESNAENQRAYGAMTAYRDALRVLDIAREVTP